MNKLGFINEQLNDVLSVPYEFGQWNSSIQYPYFVGEVTEEPITQEDGFEQSTLLLTGFHRGALIDLEEIKDKIKKHFDPIYGLRDSDEDGTIIVFYDGAFYISTGEADLKKIQINLTIKEWKGAV